MPRARVPSASITADCLFLPWLAPRAFAEAPVWKCQRRAAQEEPARDSNGRNGRTVRGTHAGPLCRHLPNTTRPSPASPASGAYRTPTRSSLDLRYADIASFARRHARTYATAPAAWVDPFGQAQARISNPVATGTRYARRRTWREQAARETEGLDPQARGRRRVHLIEQAETRLQAHARRLQRDKRNYKNKLLYDGQYRSLMRLVLSLKQWDHTTVNVTKFTDAHAEDERWLLDAFAALDRITYARTSALTKPIAIEHDPRCDSYMRELLEGVAEDGPRRIWMNWHSLTQKQRYYETTLVYMLEHKPGYAQDLMTVLALDNELPQNKSVLLADALAYLAKVHVKGEYHLDHGWEASPAANVRKFVTTFINCADTVDSAVFSQDLLYSLVRIAEPADLKKIYDVLIQARTRLAVGTVLHFASAFARAGDTAYALQCLERRLKLMTTTGHDALVASDGFRWTCAAILRGSMREAKNYLETPDIVRKFVEFGLKMDLLLYDVVMHNAMDAGDFATAFKVFNALEDNGLTADKYTYSILLHGCTIQNDPTMFKAFADFCWKRARELEDPWLATDYLYYLYICEQTKDAPSRDNSLIWWTFLDLFDPTPLRPFTKSGSRAMRDNIAHDQETSVTAPGRTKLAPTEQALYLMLQTEIQSAQVLPVAYLERLYKTFHRGLTDEKAHPTLVALAQRPLIWNTFLHAFCAKQQYASASSLIKHMTAHGTAPNIHSWNMFMQSFFKTSQVAAAERVLELMRARGIAPDAYTHGVMVRGYAKAQLIDRIGETMQSLSDEEQLDPELIRALAKVQNRADLTASLERNKSAKQAREVVARAKRESEEEERFRIPGLKSLFQRNVGVRETPRWDHGSREEADGFLEAEEESATAEVEQSSITPVSEDLPPRQGTDEDEYLEPEDREDSTKTPDMSTEGGDVQPPRA